jgi:hypothetical protein
MMLHDPRFTPRLIVFTRTARGVCAAAMQASDESIASSHGLVWHFRPENASTPFRHISK